MCSEPAIDFNGSKPGSGSSCLMCVCVIREGEEEGKWGYAHVLHFFLLFLSGWSLVKHAQANAYGKPASAPGPALLLGVRSRCPGRHGCHPTESWAERQLRGRGAIGAGLIAAVGWVPTGVGLQITLHGSGPGPSGAPLPSCGTFRASLHRTDPAGAGIVPAVRETARRDGGWGKLSTFAAHSVPRSNRDCSPGCAEVSFQGCPPR